MSIKSFISSKILLVTARWLVLLLSFLLPIFFLNFSVEVLETGKQLLLVVLVAVALVLWLGSVVAEKKIVCRGGWIVNLLPILFLGAVLFSSIFSLAGYRTWVGQSSQEYTSFLTLISFVAGFFIIEHLAGDRGFGKKILTAFLASASLAALLSWPQLFGWDKLSLLPVGFSNSVGSVTSFTIYLLVIGLLGLGLWLASDKRQIGNSLMTFVILGTALLFCFSINFWLLWFLLAFGVLLLTGWFFKKEVGKRKMFILLSLFFVSLLMIFIPSPFRFKTSVVITPSYVSSFNITKQVLSQNARRFVFGSGPGTFVYDYAQFKSPEVNKSFLWSVNFDRAKANFLTGLSTIGVLGAGLWLFFVLFLMIRVFQKKVEPALVVPWLILVVTQIFYTSNLTLGFVFWSLSGFLAAQLVLEKEIHFSRAPRIGLGFSLGFVALSLISAAALLAVGGRYVSEVAFAKAIKLDEAGAPAAEATLKISQAVSYNNFSDLYYKNYSQAIFKQLNSTLVDYTKDGSEIDENEKAVIQKLLLATMAAADRAVQLAPYDITSWSQRGNIYRDVLNLVGEAEDTAVNSYLVASKLEPSNPIPLVNLGRLYLVVADRAINLENFEDQTLVEQAKTAASIALASAEEYLTKAVALKSDYAPANYYLAAVYERQNKTVEAIAHLESLLQTKSNSVGLELQLALLYIKDGNSVAAQNLLEKMIAANPNYSNARWYLASIYEFGGDFDQAIAQVSKVLELNSDNQKVKDRLSELQVGKTAAEMPPPLEEEAGEVIVGDDLVE